MKKYGTAVIVAVSARQPARTFGSNEKREEGAVDAVSCDGDGGFAT